MLLLRVVSAAVLGVFGDRQGVRTNIEPDLHVYSGSPSRRPLLLHGCGELCDYSITGQPGPFFDTLRKRVDCMALWRNVEIDASSSAWPPPKQPPADMLADYTMGGRVKLGSWYIAEKYAGHTAREPVWAKAAVDTRVAQAKAGTLDGTYGRAETSSVMKTLQRACHEHRDMCVDGKHILVIGSQRPWFEALLLANGARNITTVEYATISSEHPQITTMLPSELRRQFLAGTHIKFDGVATYSSVEHSGLGRYGDALNPWGDIQTIAKGWCVTKPGGPLFVGVPVWGADSVEFNAHRVYGKVRYPHLVANWEQVVKGNGGQALHVLRRTSDTWSW